MKVCGIYKVTSPTGKVYIGQSKNIDQRRIDYKKLNCSKQVKLHSSLKKYGFENHSFETVHALPNDVEQKVLDQYEQLYMDFYKDAGIELINLKEGGIGGRVCEESRKKIADSKRGNKWNVGRKHSDETKKRMSESRKGRMVWNSGKKGSQTPWNKGKKGVQVAWNKGITGVFKASEETKKLLSEQRKGNKHALGYKHTDETKKIISDRMKGDKHPMYGKKRPDTAERNRTRKAA